MAKLKQIYRNYFQPRYSHVKRYLDKLNLEGDYSESDKKDIERLKKKAYSEFKAVRRFQIISIILYGVIYFSIISFILSSLEIVNPLIRLIGNLIAAIGFPIFIGAQLFVTRIKNIRFERLSLYTSHLISYSVKK